MRLVVKPGKMFQEDDAVGKSLGYAVHATRTLAALCAVGVDVLPVGSVVPADVALHLCPAHLVRHDPLSRFNVLYTAWESPDLPPDYVDGARGTDLIIGTSDFVAHAFRKALPLGPPVRTVPLGVDCRVFPYVKRRWRRGEPFTWLWVGAADPRKGFDLVARAWTMAKKPDNCWLWMKTTGRGQIEHCGNMVVDSRRLSVSGMADLYRQANGFAFPSLGEGFGLPLAEAMATGLPCLFVDWGGVREFCDSSVAYAVPHDVVAVNYGVETVGALARVADMAETMTRVMADYPAAVRRGKAASRRIRAGFTWAHTGRTLKTALEDLVNGKLHRRA
jgi:glycosyltransferase involved in cell wall biosynthesis